MCVFDIQCPLPVATVSNLEHNNLSMYSKDVALVKIINSITLIISFLSTCVVGYLVLFEEVLSAKKWSGI